MKSIFKFNGRRIEESKIILLVIEKLKYSHFLRSMDLISIS